MSLQSTMVNSRVTRPTSSLIDHQLKLVKKRRLSESTGMAQQKTYLYVNPNSYTIYKAEINYVLSDSGDAKDFPNEPIVIEDATSNFNTLLVRDTDSHNNTFVAVSTKSTGGAINPLYPTVYTYHNREETIEQQGMLSGILFVAKTVAPA